MQAFGHQLDSNLMDDSQPMGPDPVYSEELAKYMPVAGRADRLASNIPGGSQSSWGNNGDHMGSGMGGSNN